MLSRGRVPIFEALKLDLLSRSIHSLNEATYYRR
ncbi:unnamed protein product [Mycetohabitans rhizoxinica HKI 454]|uniref:Uncharacterized protein n=1 Tax=Mycetohabitans rhizoxinica (strain DSM 19002 / CIP 109453 / HKI 454) TaxID=882378 RepID=E5AT14_MYCRK|nr:unnamed protein product [Mycetohabitans rhizoxinica HKI 454]